MSSNALRFETNVPEVIELAFSEGLPVNSKFSGDQVLFTLADGRKMYVAPIVAQKIYDAGIDAYQPFQICKRELKQGNRRIVEYQVSPVPAADALPINAPATLENKPLPMQSAIGSVPSSQNGRGLHAVPPPAAAPAVPPVPAPRAAAPSFDANAVALMKIAGIGAIDAVLEVEQYAQSRGLTDFVFGADNVQKFAACLFIELCKKAGRA